MENFICNRIPFKSKYRQTAICSGGKNRTCEKDWKLWGESWGDEGIESGNGFFRWESTRKILKSHLGWSKLDFF